MHKKTVLSWQTRAMTKQGYLCRSPLTPPLSLLRFAAAFLLLSVFLYTVFPSAYALFFLLFEPFLVFALFLFCEVLHGLFCFAFTVGFGLFQLVLTILFSCFSRSAFAFRRAFSSSSCFFNRSARSLAFCSCNSFSAFCCASNALRSASLRASSAAASRLRIASISFNVSSFRSSGACTAGTVS